MTPTPIAAFVSSRFPADQVAAQLQSDAGWQVLSAVRAEDEARFFEQTVPAVAAMILAGHGSWKLLAWPKVEGTIGHVEERACDHLCSYDLAALARIIPDVSVDDMAALVRAAERADEDAIAQLGARLAQVPLTDFPNELYSPPTGATRLCRALRTRFDDVAAEVAFLLTRSSRFAMAGGSALAQAHGSPWPEAAPTHNRTGTNAIRALTFGAWVAGAADQIKPILASHMAKGRVETAGLPWDQRWFGVGGGQAVNVNRCGCVVISVAGKAHRQLEVLPNRPRCSVKVHKKEARAIADFDKRIEKASAKHGLVAVDPSTLGPALSRSAGSLPSDFTLGLLGMGAPLPEQRVELFRGDPEEARRALAAGVAPDQVVWFDGTTPYLEMIDRFYGDLQRVEVFVAAGGRTDKPERARQAAERGEIQLLKLLLQAGAPKPEANEQTARWPRIHALLSAAG